MTRTRLGMLTPSSNTVLEPTTAHMLAGLPDVTAHFGRFRVTRIALAEDALAQFDPAPIVTAAELLADAHMDVVAWNGTSAGWLGFESDKRLCAAITGAIGVPATSSVLALNEALATLGARSLGLVTPYTADVQARIVQNYAASPTPVIAERHMGAPGNYSFAAFTDDQVAGLVREVAAARPDAMAILCTNMRGAALVPALEAELGIPILDSIAVTVWKSLALAGVAPSRVEGWEAFQPLRDRWGMRRRRSSDAGLLRSALRQRGLSQSDSEGCRRATARAVAERQRGLSQSDSEGCRRATARAVAERQRGLSQSDSEGCRRATARAVAERQRGLSQSDSEGCRRATARAVAERQRGLSQSDSEGCRRATARAVAERQRGLSQSDSEGCRRAHGHSARCAAVLANPRRAAPRGASDSP